MGWVEEFFIQIQSIICVETNLTLSTWDQIELAYRILDSYVSCLLKIRFPLII